MNAPPLPWTHAVTCRTEGCACVGRTVPMTLLLPDGTEVPVVCGTCGEQITDVVPLPTPTQALAKAPAKAPTKRRGKGDA